MPQLIAGRLLTEAPAPMPAAEMGPADVSPDLGQHIELLGIQVFRRLDEIALSWTAMKRTAFDVGQHLDRAAKNIQRENDIDAAVAADLVAQILFQPAPTVPYSFSRHADYIRFRRKAPSAGIVLPLALAQMAFVVVVVHGAHVNLASPA